MKGKLIVWVLLAMLLPVGALADKTGFGIVAGGLYPVAQDDQETGMTYGAKFRFRLTGPLVMEPNANFGSFGDAQIAGVGSRDGSTMNHYGLDLLLGGLPASIGPKPFLFVGGGVYNIKRDGAATVNKSGWSFGAGLAVGIMKILDIELRGRFNIASWAGSTSKKSVAVTGGLIYYFGKDKE
jgi:hypothetical protein